VQLVFKISNLCAPDPTTLQTDRQQTTRNLNTAIWTIVHRAVKNEPTKIRRVELVYCKAFIAEM